jgi:chromosome segregation protein
VPRSSASARGRPASAGSRRWARPLSREGESRDARAALVEAEQAQETAREERTVWQVERAQAQARLQVATDRERRLARELTTAAERLDALQRELATLSLADGDLASGWPAGG